MNTRFVVLSVLTVVFEVICAIILVLGLVAVFGDQHAANDPNNPFAQLPIITRIAGGAVLFFFGLTGLVFSGGIHVLISIDANTQALNEKLSALLQKTPSVTPLAISPAIAGGTDTGLNAAPVSTRVAEAQCSQCGRSNSADSRFCEACGNPLTTS